MNDSFSITGMLTVQLFRCDGTIKEVIECKNTVTLLGKSHVADQLAKTPAQSPMIAMAVGTGTPSTTALGSESSRNNIDTRTASGKVVTYVAHWDIEDDFSATITEAGIFNSSSLGGTMLCSAVLSPSIVKAVNDSIVITWNLTIH